MNTVDRKYCGIVSTRVDRFKIKSENPYRANFRCPLCGDSQKSKTKARGWLIGYPSVTMYTCHNCGEKLPLGAFLKRIAPALFDEYVIDTKIDRDILFGVEEVKEKTLPVKAPKFKTSPLKQLQKISSLQSDHPAKKYVIDRQIPAHSHYKLYYAPKFNAWVNSILPNKIKTEVEVPRLVLPFIDADGKLFGFQGRSLSKDGLRYITIMLDESKPKVFGLDTVDFNKRYFIVEGPIDSLFLDNALAMSGADVSDLDNENAVFVYDNEPRNRDICRLMEKKIDAGKKIVIWPEDIPEKDINDMILAGRHSRTKGDMNKLLDRYTYNRLTAKLQFSIWRKC